MNSIKHITLLNKLYNITKVSNLIRTITNTTQLSYEKDPAPMFMDAVTQKILKSITQMQIGKIYRRTTVLDNSLEYKFMTNEQLEEEFWETIERAKRKLQMPPVVMIRPDSQTVISADTELKNFSDTKFIFTDITYGIKHSERKVVVRETDGTLHDASMEITKRMKQLYVPINGRKIRQPKMFDDENFQRCLDDHKYEFVLDRLVIQYDPYEPEYHRLTGQVYQHLNESKEFDQLRSTRHFGPMAFYYAWHKCIDDLLYDMIKRDYLCNAAQLISLQYKLHAVPENYHDLLKKLEERGTLEECAFKELMKQIQTKTIATDIQEDIEKAIGKNSEDFEMDELCLEFIEKFVQSHALKKVPLELAIQTLREINAEKKQLFDGLTKAHGIQNT